MGQLARCASLLGDVGRAEDLAVETVGMLADVVCPPGAANLPGSDAYIGVAWTLVDLDEPERARALIEPIADAGVRYGWLEASVGGAIVRGACEAALGDREAAVGCLTGAAGAAAEAGLPVLERDARRGLARVLDASDPAGAEAERRAADELDRGLRGNEDGASLRVQHGSGRPASGKEAPG